MATDIYAAADFYATARGMVAGRLVGERLERLWPALGAGGCGNLAVLGLGYAAPYLDLWREAAARCVAAIPGAAGAARWPADAANRCCTVPEDALPFPDLCFDRVLLVHGVEAAENARRLLREVWRVLRDDGRLLVVAPNRAGVWALVESTPFGQGQPYSPGQIGRLLAASLFRVERRDTALYLPPVNMRLLLRGARFWESCGRALVPRLAGVTITEAVKDLYAAVPVRAVPRRKLALAEAA
ncbi:MAG: methyltransferase domain-containing protein [Alphaproteobacteria bacterium]|nr:methyltransferase domain-containing protein [Alphaproteobacteria bacterium]